MGDFDLSLISEFRNRRSFYDRSSPRFKDKIYNAHQWQEISNKLGFDVSILKDRILQLRNRYNLEKRRIEQLKEENPDKYVASPWPLYEHLHFLSDHIRARRSYKKMMPLNSGTAEYSNSCSNNSTIMAASHHAREGRSTAQNLTPFPNGLLTVKMEEVDSDEQDTDTESQNNDSEGNAFEPSALIPETHSVIPPELHQQLHQQQLLLQQHSQQNLQNLQQQQQQQHPTIGIRRLDSLRQEYDATSNSKKRFHHTSFNQSQREEDSASSAAAVTVKQPRLSAREQKYAAFGNFISSSLLDLPQNSALELVEKFTSDIVKSLMVKAEQFNDLAENDQ